METLLAYISYLHELLFLMETWVPRMIDSIQYCFKDFMSYLERGEGREKGRKRNINVRKKHQSVASCLPQD